MAKTRNVFFALAIISTVVMISNGCAEKDPAPKSTVYDLKAEDVLGVTGTVTFTETSATLATIDIALFGAPSGTHPAELRMNSAVEDGDVVVQLNPIDETGKSSTVVTAKTYAQLISYDGFIKIHKSNFEPNVILARGDIGGNLITSTNKTYQLAAIGTYGVSGNALFEKRLNGNTLVTISLIGTISGDTYPASINLGNIASIGGGPVVKTLNHVDGASGKSYTNIRALNSGIAISYNNWLMYDGYINIQQTSVNSDHIICHGNIGTN